MQVGEQSLPTDVQPLGNAIFGVSFETLDSSSDLQNTPLKQTTYSTQEELSSARQQPHIIYITFNDDNVPGNNNHNSS